MILSVVLLISSLVLSVQGYTECATKSGKTCNKNHRHNFFVGADPCFDYNGKSVCFYSYSDMVSECDCTITDCNCATSGDQTSSLSCDNSVVPTSSDCSADQAKYCTLGQDNTKCEYCGVNTAQCGYQICALGITDEKEKAIIVDKHNELRRKVAKGEETQGLYQGQPGASDMNELVWDDEVADMAQNWANQCSAGNPAHDTNRKMVDGSTSGQYCGQNVYSSWNSAGPSSDKGLANAVEAWYDEVKDFDNAGVYSYGSGSDSGITGHYTQVVWGSVSKIGCGYTYRIDSEGWYRETVVCNYCTGGNMLGAKMYITGTAGTGCPTDHPTNNDGLCKA